MIEGFKKRNFIPFGPVDHARMTTGNQFFRKPRPLNQSDPVDLPAGIKDALLDGLDLFRKKGSFPG